MERKKDRRTLYTEAVIKDSLISLISQGPYSTITASALCRRAEITRTTFYAHYSSVDEVLDAVIDDALTEAEEKSGNPVTSMEKMIALSQKGEFQGDVLFALLPACQRVAEDERYRPLFLDPGLGEHISRRIYMRERKVMVPIFMQNFHLDEEQADRLFLFITEGAYSVNRALMWKQDDEWKRCQRAITGFIAAGFASLSKAVKD